ncbi:hypothetical protein WA026_000329 [Henosepilachna vigintioctopunctata]|uniref:Uncharacterized protein n=1 Tax=Henosepilachna vigintioctopunctata TaxID=420089 RepID=A0AAW1V5Q3_9CUCU
MTEGSEDEVEVTTQIIRQEDLSMEKTMVPPQIECSTDFFKRSEYINNNVKELEDACTMDNFRLIPKSIKDNRTSSVLKYVSDSNHQFGDMQHNGMDLMYLRSREVVLASGVLPSELEIRENGVFARTVIAKGTRYGPFQGKWASTPQDPRFAWEYLIFRKIRDDPKQKLDGLFSLCSF